jgi:glycosyltransferase involved in cell wall biosynthesis
MSEYNMRVVQKKIANIWPISKYLAHYYNKCHTLVLPPLISITDDKWTNNISIESLKIDSTCDLRLLFAGTPGRKDLLANLVQATTILLDYGHNVQLLVVGVNQDESTTYCDAEIIQKYPNNIAFLGRIPQSMVPSVYKLSDFSAIIREPNRKNTAGFPTKMAESMVAGCPVILTETSDLLDYAQDGINAILIPDSSINSIVTGLHRAINLSREDLNRMKREAKATGESFDFNQYVTDVDKFLLNLKKQ